MASLCRFRFNSGLFTARHGNRLLTLERKNGERKNGVITD
jgi:hypothetical protein